MTRKRVTLAYITNDVERKASFRKRKNGLINKVRELSTLCDVDACAIIYSPYDQEPEVWPSRARAESVLAHFRNLSEMDRTGKMVNQESFTQLRVKRTHVQLIRLQQDRRRREMERFMFKCIAGMASLDSIDLRSNSSEMRWVINHTLRELTSRMNAMKISSQDASSSAAGADRAVQVVTPPALVEEAALPASAESLEGYNYLLDVVRSPTGAGGSGLGWDTALLPY